PVVIRGGGIGGGLTSRFCEGRAIAAGTASPPMMGEFLAYDPRYFGGVFVAAGDVNGDRRADIVTGTNGNGGPEVKAFNGPTVPGNPTPVIVDDFFAYDPAFNGGAVVAITDADGDGEADIITGAGPGAGPHVRIFNGATSMQAQNNVVDSFMAFDPTFTGGVFVGGA